MIFVFKAVFGKNPDLLLALLNSFPEFADEKQIEQLYILNPEIPKDFQKDKLSILDIQATDKNGNRFLIEMQVSHKTFFEKRILYYWAKLYSKSILKGQKYEKLPKVYSFNFVNFSLLPNTNKFHSVFHLLEKSDLKYRLTEDLEIHIIELRKFSRALESLETNLDTWIFLLREAQNLRGEQMKTLEKKNPKIKKTISELKVVSYTNGKRADYEARLKGEFDYNTDMGYAFDQGLEKGIEQGIEKVRVSILLAIEMVLELKFHSEGLKLFTEVQKIKDVDRLQKILLKIKKAKYLSEIKKML
ncbi:MAG: PD-(D/E)XK nuclease family transposase [Leptospiraceae bacterium]|nr:PD-(D/E)XK nuclease family transposase [Leptospiraceae bacterium]